MATTECNTLSNLMVLDLIYLSEPVFSYPCRLSGQRNSRFEIDVVWFRQGSGCHARREEFGTSRTWTFRRRSGLLRWGIMPGASRSPPNSRFAGNYELHCAGPTVVKRQMMRQGSGRSPAPTCHFPVLGEGTERSLHLQQRRLRSASAGVAPAVSTTMAVIRAASQVQGETPPCCNLAASGL